MQRPGQYTVLTTAALLITPALAPAEEKFTPRPSRGFPEKVIAQKLIPLLNAPDLLRGLTRSKGGAEGKIVQAPRLQGLNLSVVYHQESAEEWWVADTVFGYEVPGRRITVKVRVKCEVRVEFDLNELKPRRDPDYPDTWHLHLPAF